MDTIKNPEKAWEHILPGSLQEGHSLPELGLAQPDAFLSLDGVRQYAFAALSDFVCGSLCSGLRD